MSEVQAFSVEQVMELLQRVELFQGLLQEELRRVADIVEGVELETDEVLFEEGEPGDAFYAVFSGAVEIVKGTGSGLEKLAVRRSGEAFGEMALLDEAPRSATARAVEETRLVSIPREEFQGILGGDSLAVRVMRLLSQALRALGTRFAASEKLAASRAAAPAGDLDAVSRVVQRGLLPRSAPNVPGYDVAAGTTTEDHGRGDTVWDWLELAGGETALLAYDVQGEGLPPSHHLATVRVLLRALAAEESDPKEILRKANAALSHAVVEGTEQFIECGMAVLHDDAVEWSAAGRVPAGLIRRNGTFEEFGSHGPTLGMMEGFRYSSARVEMGPGDVFVVLSQASVGLFRGAADLVAQVQGKPAGEVVSTLHRAIRKAHGEEPSETSVIFLRKH